MARKISKVRKKLQEQEVLPPVYDDITAERWAKSANMVWFHNYEEYKEHYKGKRKITDNDWKRQLELQDKIKSGQYQSVRSNQFKKAYIKYLQDTYDDYNEEDRKKVLKIINKLNRMDGEMFESSFNQAQVNRITDGNFNTYDLGIMYVNKGMTYAPTDKEDFIDFMEDVIDESGIEDNEESIESFEEVSYYPNLEKQLRRIGRKRIENYLDNGIDDPYEMIAEYVVEKIQESTELGRRKNWKYGISKEDADKVEDLVDIKLYEDD